MDSAAGLSGPGSRPRFCSCQHARAMLFTRVVATLAPDCSQTRRRRGPRRIGGRASGTAGGGEQPDGIERVRRVGRPRQPQSRCRPLRRIRTPVRRRSAAQHPARFGRVLEDQAEAGPGRGGRRCRPRAAWSAAASADGASVPVAAPVVRHASRVTTESVTGCRMAAGGGDPALEGELEVALSSRPVSGSMRPAARPRSSRSPSSRRSAGASVDSRPRHGSDRRSVEQRLASRRRSSSAARLAFGSAQVPAAARAPARPRQRRSAERPARKASTMPMQDATIHCPDHRPLRGRIKSV